jgi:hypothetical protein
MRFYFLMCLLYVTTFLTSVDVSAKPHQSQKIIPITPQMLRGKLAYIHNKSGELYAVKPDGTGRIKIATLPIDPGRGWSNDYLWGPVAFDPSLTRLVFAGFSPVRNGPHRGGGATELYLMDLRTRHVRQITNWKHEYTIELPRWSPNGMHLLYQKWSWGKAGGEPYRIQVIDMATLEDRVLKLTDFAINAFWSRDGLRVLFSTQFNKDTMLSYNRKTINLDGSNISEFDGDWSAWLYPAVSKDGNLLWQKDKPGVYVHMPGHYYLHQRRVDKGVISYVSQEVALSNHFDLWQYNPFWSSNNKDIAFEASQHYTHVQPDGLGVLHGNQGVWVFRYQPSATTDGTLRRLATDAQIVGWL